MTFRDQLNKHRTGTASGVQQMPKAAAWIKKTDLFRRRIGWSIAVICFTVPGFFVFLANSPFLNWWMDVQGYTGRLRPGRDTRQAEPQVDYFSTLAKMEKEGAVMRRN
eukprot:TRINITY_DN1704_c0_g1_i1.p1 TRINITY_DN1704_c0_g1~~TRINITY_DN1704_c0_g1_i1.p1  ORF type:complete len:108 (-),score=15.86 TRINITY_DN1704_c0_g1_i1:103-426(-)